MQIPTSEWWIGRSRVWSWGLCAHDQMPTSECSMSMSRGVVVRNFLMATEWTQIHSYAKKVEVPAVSRVGWAHFSSLGSRGEGIIKYQNDFLGCSSQCTAIHKANPKRLRLTLLKLKYKMHSCKSHFPHASRINVFLLFFFSILWGMCLAILHKRT